jgi:hypothetical protein
VEPDILVDVLDRSVLDIPGVEEHLRWYGQLPLHCVSE